VDAGNTQSNTGNAADLADVVDQIAKQDVAERQVRMSGYAANLGDVVLAEHPCDAVNDPARECAASPRGRGD
jgi:hypothetical protein